MLVPRDHRNGHHNNSLESSNTKKNAGLSQGAKIVLAATGVCTTLLFSYLAVQQPSQPSSSWDFNWFQSSTQSSLDYTPIIFTGFVGLFSAATCYLKSPCRKEKTFVRISNQKMISNCFEISSNNVQVEELTTMPSSTSVIDPLQHSVTDVKTEKNLNMEVNQKEEVNERVNKKALLTFEDYEQEMNRLNLPLILIVGCGHGPLYEHEHPHSRCVNISYDTEYKSFFDPVTKSFIVKDEGLIKHFEGFSELSEEDKAKEFKEKAQFDEIVDISDVISKKYINKFDVVVLERPLPSTLNKPWTLYNAVSMLKVGGELVIDTNERYRSDLYEYDSNFYEKGKLFAVIEEDSFIDQLKSKKAFEKSLKHKSFYLTTCLSKHYLKKNYKNSTKSEKYSEKIKSFEIKKINENSLMTPMANYLTRWELTDIVNEKKAYQPYAERKTCLISATKSQLTEEAMPEWRKALKYYKPK